MEHAQAISLRPSGRLKRRQAVSTFMKAVFTASAVLALVVLGIVIVSVAHKGASALNWAFFTQSEPENTFLNVSGGGIAFAFMGTVMATAIATVIALPLGVLSALAMTEFSSPKWARLFRTSFDIINGIPSIVIGIFAYGLIVLRFGQSALAGGIALAVIMLPLIARATQEVLLLVPASLREGSLALGVSKWRTTLSVVLPSAVGGILTGTTLAVARAVGETAPLLFTCSFGLRTGINWNPLDPQTPVTVIIFEYSEQADPAYHAKAWAAAFALMMFVLITSLSARLLYARSRRKLGA